MRALAPTSMFQLPGAAGDALNRMAWLARTLPSYTLECGPDLILMDIQLPGMDGLQATALLKRNEATRGIPVIALTALAMKGDEERIRAAGCDGYVAKPLAYKDFLAVIREHLVKSGSALP